MLGLGFAGAPCRRRTARLLPPSGFVAIQTTLFETDPALPEGFGYRPGLISQAQEHALLEEFVDLPFQPFRFHGHVGLRRTLSFGWGYDFEGGGLGERPAVPRFLLPLRAAAARFAGLEPEALPHALVIEYRPGAAIGWHRDRPEFGDVIGVSLASAAPLRLRRRKAAGGWDRVTVVAEPRSAYLLRGPSRTEWEHSIPPMEALRYSVTFRTLERPRGQR